MSAPTSPRPWYCGDCGERVRIAEHTCPGPGLVLPDLLRREEAVSELSKIEAYTRDPLVLECAQFLESIGKRFLVDFGHENAVRVAEEHMGLSWYSTAKLRLALRIREDEANRRWLESPINAEAGDVPMRRKP